MVWILASILVILIVIGLFRRLSDRSREKSGKPGKTNYRMLYNMGRIMCLIGLAGMVTSVVMGYSFVTALPIFSIGLVYLIIGWSKRDTWN